jgi:hypothetical protein
VKIAAILVMYATAFTFGLHIYRLRSLDMELLADKTENFRDTRQDKSRKQLLTYTSLFPVICFLTAFLGHTYLREPFKNRIFSILLFVNAIWIRCVVMPYRKAIAHYAEQLIECESHALKGSWIERTLCFCFCAAVSTPHTQYCMISTLSEENCVTFQDQLQDAIDALTALETPSLLVMVSFAFVLFFLSPKTTRDDSQNGALTSMTDGTDWVYDELPVREDDVADADADTGEEEKNEEDDPMRDTGIEMSALTSVDCPILAQADAVIVRDDSRYNSQTAILVNAIRTEDV